MGRVLYPGYYPCGEFISNGGLVYTPLNLDNLTAEMAVYWRVKKWKATVVVAQGPGYGGGPIGTFIQYGFWDANTEEELCCHKATYFQNDPISFSDGDSDWQASFFGFAFKDQKPFLWLSYSPIDESTWQDITSFPQQYYTEGQLTVENFNISPITISTYSSLLGPNYEASISVTIRADEYWSYGGTYNTETGERL